MRVAVAHADPGTLIAFERCIARCNDMTLVWSGSDGLEALRACCRATPDVMLVGLDLLRMGGVELVANMMAKAPCPIVLIAQDANADAARVFAGMSAGALDVIVGPGTIRTEDDYAVLLQRKVAMAARLAPDVAARNSLTVPLVDNLTLLAIGASAGGPAAVGRVLADLAADLPVATVIVQHVDPIFSETMARWLDTRAAASVAIARTGDVPRAGRIYLAGGSDHLVMRRDGSFAYTAEPRDAAYSPSVDVLFGSIARYWQGPSIGVVLSGMGRDGAAGLRLLRESGARTIAQDETSSAVYGMPRAAVDEGGAGEILPVEEIGSSIAHVVRSRQKNIASGQGDKSD